MTTHARRLQALTVAAPVGRGDWLAALIGARTRLRRLDHYPEDDVIDRRSGAQFFVHTHDADTHGFAHYHCFVRLPGRELGLTQRRVTTHIAALVVDSSGRPVRLLALNQWATGELWQPARSTLALLERLRFEGATPHAVSGRWLESVLHVFWPELRHILAKRDKTLSAALRRDPQANVLQDRRREILAAVPLDLDRRLAALAPPRRD